MENNKYSFLAIGKAKKRRTDLDEVLDMLDRTAKRIQKTLEENKEFSAKQAPIYEQILLSKDASEAQKVKALFGKAFELDRLERLSAQLSLLYTLQIFAFKVKVLEIEVGNIDEELEKSGVLEKHMEIDSIKKNIEALKILVEAQYESLKEIRANQDKNLQYIN
ncbi:TPA: hypothetical protein HA274_03120 [Candidatus Bathyarchaeota archaeon]|nr:hypothetical protein [Candidatus Bathyarchaeota archaeon]